MERKLPPVLGTCRQLHVRKCLGKQWQLWNISLRGTVHTNAAARGRHGAQVHLLMFGRVPLNALEDGNIMLARIRAMDPSKPRKLSVRRDHGFFEYRNNVDDCDIFNNLVLRESLGLQAKFARRRHRQTRMGALFCSVSSLWTASVERHAVLPARTARTEKALKIQHACVPRMLTPERSI